jgi:Trk K+ transport system NAD-binding subunit
LVARLLRVRAPERETTVILGAEELALELGEVLRRSGKPILFVDKNPASCRVAEQRGLPVVFGDALAPSTAARLRLERASAAIGLTSNTDLNYLFTLEAQQEYGVENVYVAAARRRSDESARLAQRHATRVLFDRPKEIERWNVRLRHGLAERAHLRAAETPSPQSAAAPPSASPDAFVILAVRRGNWLPMHSGWEIKPGDEAIALIHKQEAREARERLRAMGWELAAVESSEPGPETQPKG